jgi:hypothetical protein
MGVKTAVAIEDGRLEDGEYWSEGTSIRMAMVYMQQLINEARYCPEDIALRRFLRTKEVGLEQLQRALNKGWDKEVCQVAMKGARISIQPPLCKDLYQSEF